MTDTILETAGLTRAFGGFVAVDDVALRVRTGSIHALIGPNGAGKTTCFNMLTKFLAPTRGTIHFKGRDITRLKPAQVARLGLARSFQISAVFPHLTALENVRLALQRARGASFDFWRSEQVLNVYNDRARELLFDVGLSDVRRHRGCRAALWPQAGAGDRHHAGARSARCCCWTSRPPAWRMTTCGRIVELIARVREGRTILMVEHNLSVVEGLCDIITVLTRGRVLAEGDYATVSKNPEVIAAYLGSRRCLKSAA